MLSKTFQAGKYRVRVRCIVQRRPKGLAGVGWSAGGVDLNVKIDDVNHKAHGSIGTTDDKFYVALGSIEPYIKHINTYKTQPFNDQESAFDFVCDYIKKGLTNDR